MEESAAWRVVRYVEQNPVRAGLARRAADYAWSSARTHLCMETQPVLDHGWWEARWTPAAWASVLEEAGEQEEAIRLATFSGRPYGSGGFVRSLEVELGRRLERRKGRRPRKHAEEPGQMPLWAAGI